MLCFEYKQELKEDKKLYHTSEIFVAFSPSYLCSQSFLLSFQMLVKGEDDDYRLNLGRYSGTAGDSFSHHNGMRFTTPDRDNDLWWANCGLKDQSGWWFNACSHSSLNGIYHHMGNGSALRRSSPDGTNTGIQWYEWKSDPGYSLKRVEMKIKPRPAVAMQKTERLQDAGNGKRPEQPPDKKNREG